MSNYTVQQVPGLHNAANGNLVGFLGADGREYLLPALDPAQQAFIDQSGTPGNCTINAVKGKAAFAAAASTVVVTNNFVTTNSVVIVSQVGSDTTLNNIVTVTPANGSFTVAGNAAATATPAFNFFVLN